MSKNQILTDKHGLFFFLIILVVATRLLPHPLNFTPIGALGLFSGAYIIDKRAWSVPIIALLISDVFIGFYNPLVMAFVYLGFAMSAVIGNKVLAKKRTGLRVLVSAIGSASLFFILSNFGHWLSGLNYPMTLAGLIECYVMAIPFYGNTLMGDIFYASLLFATFEFMRGWLDKHQHASAA